MAQHPPQTQRHVLAIFRPLAGRDFSLLTAGLTVSLIGDGIFYVALAFQVYELSNSPTALSLVGLAWTGALMAFLLLGGVAADRFERRRIIVASDLVRAASLIALGFLSISGSLALWHVVVLSLVYGAATAFFQPAMNAIIPDLIPADLLVEANSLNQAIEPLAFRFAGPALGGMIVAGLGTGAAFMIDGLTFLVSVVCVALLKPGRVPTAERESIKRSIGEGFAYVRSQPWLWATFLASTVGLLAFYGPWEVLVPFLVKNELGGGAGVYGSIVAAGGVGAVIASTWFGHRGLPQRHILVLYLVWGLGTFLVSAYAFVTSAWQAMVVSFVLSAMFAAGMVIWNTLMHRLVPAHLLGRVSSLDWLVSGGLIPLSFAITGPVAGAIGTDATLVWAGVLGGVATLAALAFPRVRDTETDGSVHPNGNGVTAP